VLRREAIVVAVKELALITTVVSVHHVCMPTRLAGAVSTHDLTPHDDAWSVGCM